MRKNILLVSIIGLTVLCAVVVGNYLQKAPEVTAQADPVILGSIQATASLWGKADGSMASTTGSYVCGTTTNIAFIPQNVVLATADSSTAAGSAFDFYFEYAEDGATTFFRDVIGSVGSISSAAATTTLGLMSHSFRTTDGTAVRFNVPKPAAARQVRMCVRETGTATKGGFGARFIRTQIGN